MRNMCTVERPESSSKWIDVVWAKSTAPFLNWGVIKSPLTAPLKTPCSITYIPLLCLCDVAASLFLQLHASRERGCSVVGRGGLAPGRLLWGNVVCSLMTLRWLQRLLDSHPKKESFKDMFLLLQLYTPWLSWKGYYTISRRCTYMDV